LTDMLAREGGVQAGPGIGPDGAHLNVALPLYAQVNGVAA